MNIEVIKLFKKVIVFSIPILIWILVVLLIDPFNYFDNNNIIKKEHKEKASKQLNSLLYNCIEFSKKPTRNIIIGDSRIRNFSTKRIKKLTDDDYYLLYSNAAKLNEMIDLFWFANSKIKLRNVLFGINFNLYNQYAYADRVKDVEEIIQNPLIYIFNQNILESVYLSLKYEYISVPAKNVKDKNKFWEYTVNTVAKNHFEKYLYPKDLLKKLKEINIYCNREGINLTLVIVPSHEEYRNKLTEYNLSDAERSFKSEIKEIGEVIDFDYTNAITTNKSCFGDPLHTTESTSRILIDEIFTDSLVLGRKL
ncbi:MAG: hypothetical protein VX347_00930 [Bacteroidota bacterium]|nr:hypothetical protein [Bacteroidota bacterium]